MSKIDELLKVSIVQYQKQLEQLLVLEAHQGHGAIEALLDLQRQAQETDERLLPLLIEAGPRMAAHPLLLRRQELLEALLAENRRLLPMFEGRKAVLASEMSQCRAGQIAMAGYKVGPQAKGRRLSRSC